MSCPTCGTENRPGARFCVQCGSPLTRACASCGAAYSEGERFCAECGSALTIGAPTARPAALPNQIDATARSTERRHVTVLFADLVGFTPLSQQRDAEDVRALLSTYFDTARTIIARYGGEVEKFIGDAVMAVWGVPTSRENDAERAVRAALELVDAVAAFGEEVGALGLQARAGLMTGEVAVNLGATGEGMVAGDLVNTASRVQAAAEPGTVYVGDGTRVATEAAIVYEDTGVHGLKGKPEPERLWRAQRVVAAAGGALRPTGLEPPFVGRDRELRLLKEFLHATGEERTARLLSIVGLAGVGKSRLGWEFFKYVDGVTEQIWWHRGRCLAYGDGVAYWALSEMVRMRAGILENEPPDAAREKLRRTVEEFVESGEERRWVEPRLAHLVGLEERVATDPRDLYAAWRFFFERLAAQNLTVLVFEDLQWADGGLLDFIEYLLEWSRNSPILVVTLARPEMADRRAGWGTGKRGFTSLSLDPLPPEAMAQLLAGMAPGLPDDLSARILDRAAGVPLYAVETVRMLIDRGLLVAQDGAFHVEGSLDALEVPETLHALIAARLDSIGGSERQLLQDAAVLGKSFTAAGLRAITQLPADSVERCLSTLVNKDLLAIQSDPRSPERGQYVFVQDLVRSVAYGTLTRRDRKMRHLSAASYLESSWTEEEGVAEVIASHLLEAFEADPEAPDAAGLRQRACDALVRAGDHAASLAAAASAEHYYDRALQLADPADRATLHTRAGQMAWQQLHTASARRHLDEAVALHTSEGRIGAAARTSVTLAAIDAHEVKREEAAVRMERAFAELNAVESVAAEHEADLAVVAAELARRLVLARRSLDVALERVELALDTAERHGYSEVFCEAINTKGLILGLRGRREEGRALLGCALEHALASDNHRAALRAYNNIAADLQALNPAQAFVYTEKGIALARLLGLRREEIMFTIGQLPVQVDLGHWDTALSVIADVLESTDVEVTDSLLGAELIYGAWVHVWRGDLTKAQPLVKRLTELCAQAGPDYKLIHDAARCAVLRAEGRDQEALDILGDRIRATDDLWEYSESSRWAFVESVEAAFAVGDLRVVRQHLASTETGFSSAQFPLLQAHALRFRARLDAREGRDADVARTSLAALAMFEQRQMLFWAAITRLELGEWMLQRKRREEAEGLLGLARAAFVELGATPSIERVDAAVQDSGATTVDQREASSA